MVVCICLCFFVFVCVSLCFFVVVYSYLCLFVASKLKMAKFDKNGNKSLVHFCTDYQIIKL